MKIFITGITGFVGSFLAQHLRDKHEVYGYSLSGKTIEGCEVYSGDIRDRNLLEKILKKVKPEVIVHLCASTSVEQSWKTFNYIFEVNFLGTVNIIQIAEKLNFPKFIFPSSVEVYGNQVNFPIKENSILRPNSPYGLAKVACENFLRMKIEVSGFPIVIFRCTNTYGRINDTRFIVEYAISSMLTQNEVYFGVPYAIRDFLHIDDLIKAYELAIIKDIDIKCPINISTCKGTSIKELVDKIASLTKFQGSITWFSHSIRPTEIWNLTADNSRAKRILDWLPSISLDEGLKRLVDIWKTLVPKEN